MASDYYHVADWQTRLRALTHAVGLILVAYLLGAVCVFVATGLLRLGGITAESVASLPPLPYAVLTASQFVGFFLTVVAYLQWRDETDFFEVGLPSLRDVALVVGGFVALYGLNVAVSIAFQFLGVEIATNRVIEEGQQDSVRFLYMIPVTLFFVAPAEELLFRGVIQGLFRRVYGVVPGVAIASLLFGLVHYLALIGSGSGKLSYVAVAAGLGLVLGALYEVSQNIAVPIVVHGLFNSFLFVGQYLLATGAIQA